MDLSDGEEDDDDPLAIFDQTFANPSRPVVVLWVTGFMHRQNPSEDETLQHFVPKELASAGDVFDAISLLPPYPLHILPYNILQSYKFDTIHIHGMEWESGQYPFSFASQFIGAVQMRHLNTIYVSWGRLRCRYFEQYLNGGARVVDLCQLGCPSSNALSVEYHHQRERVDLDRPKPKINCNIYHLQHSQENGTFNSSCAGRSAVLIRSWLLTKLAQRRFQ